MIQYSAIAELSAVILIIFFLSPAILASMNKGYLNPDYALAYAIIKRFNLTSNDKEKIKELDMDDKIRQIIYEALGIE